MTIAQDQTETPACTDGLADTHLTELHHLGNDLEEWCEIRVWKDSVPKGATLVEAYLTEREVIVMGWPPDNDDEETGHNCDTMGCGSVGSHVLYRLPLPNNELSSGGSADNRKQTEQSARRLLE